MGEEGTGKGGNFAFPVDSPALFNEGTGGKELTAAPGFDGLGSPGSGSSISGIPEIGFGGGIDTSNPVAGTSFPEFPTPGGRPGSGSFISAGLGNDGNPPAGIARTGAGGSSAEVCGSTGVACIGAGTVTFGMSGVDGTGTASFGVCFANLEDISSTIAELEGSLIISLIPSGSATKS